MAQSWLLGMVLRRLVLVSMFLASAAIGSEPLEASASSVASVERVQDTLHSLLKSLQNLAHDYGQLFEKRQRWCADSLPGLGEEVEDARNDAARLRADFGERSAALAEAEGTAQQLQTEVLLVQHTIDAAESALGGRLANASLVRSPSDAAALSALLDSRQLTLLSLRGELDNFLPARSQLQVLVAEDARRARDRNASAGAIARFDQSIKDSCITSALRSEAEAGARASEARHINRALDALERVRAGTATSANPMPASFLQTGHEDDNNPKDELFAIFGQVADQSKGVPLSDPNPSDSDTPSTSEASSSEDTPTDDFQGSLADLEPAAASEVPPQPSLKASSTTSVAVLLASLKAAGGVAGEEHRTWCSKERAQNELLLQLARDSAEHVAMEAEGHANSEAQLAEAWSAVNSTITALGVAAAEATEGAKSELTFMEENRKDQALASKILKQAIVILRNLEETSSAQDAVQHAAAAKELAAARSNLHAQLDALGAARKATDAQVGQVALKAAAASRSLRRESEGLELARDSHVTERLRAERGRQAREAEINEATAFLQILRVGCAPAAAAALRQRGAEVKALEDAEEVLEGRAVRAEVGARALRGTAGVNMSRLSPIERAALEMGVVVDEH